MNIKPLLGHRALITGGSRGIGGAIADKLASLGCQITIMARDPKALEIKRGQLNQEFPNDLKHECIKFDLNDPERIEETLKKHLDFNSISILVNCAGQSQKKLIMQTPIDEIRRLTNVNFISPVILCKLFAKAMARRSTNAGHIVNISSIVANQEDHHLIGASVYCSTKSALSKFTKVFQRELQLGKRTESIAVHCIEPGLVAETEIGSSVAHDSGIATFSMSQVSEIVAHEILKKNNPCGNK